MTAVRLAFLKCPYCGVYESFNNSYKKHQGLFKVKQVGNFLALECMKCHKIFRMSFIGSPICWDDFSSVEKEMFRKEVRV